MPQRGKSPGGGGAQPPSSESCRSPLVLDRLPAGVILISALTKLKRSRWRECFGDTGDKQRLSPLPQCPRGKHLPALGVWGVIKGRVRDAKYHVMLWTVPPNEELTFLKCQ